MLQSKQIKQHQCRTVMWEVFLSFHKTVDHNGKMNVV
jgi:hypothetical protein